ncbi:acetyl-CoA/propionyl-CoA carboxylase, biotin carboxylase, biotin carboxyl carrier protein [Paracoccus alcaliphilus]|uniref:Acetyl-CoA/propionyl-CoA carboxylase, biotin carboxylase, biotin carboxyl carrier protein n=1 Tax=Paracoccus alcaliphilus TaxID=34002 RepID=A0A1H8FHB4_9RHOB|nr:biotin carboxylase N-terminal domain-containing protein [Paracoccus alcaliphilus]WCR19309.1 ATP-grasp domain-containing protein [Paracoccus alcaliphilus]SEN31025.1 acetyl-CoA/propionyl-CoA carboxylase, biotin carboxylase, biotin carboxyl carrier protein [Paracoccus alcaliphilus]
MKKLLVANRGEIALRIIRAARDHGAASVAIYSDEDAGALHAELADEAWGLGTGRARETYLDIDRIIGIARRAGADAVHPGYGFLSERPEFAQAVLDAGMVWVGPPPAVIAALGDKIEARRIAQAVGAPLVRGSDGPLTSGAEAVDFARQVGLPIAIKAAFGGGGRGMRIAREMDEVAELFDAATREATEAFGRGECYAEQFLDRPRHIEAQVLADRHGHVVVLGTRDCSLQRRNQKLVEEAPAPFLTPDQRDRIHKAAADICRHAGYVGAGTVEFLMSQDGVISFLEVNTRLQVEHCVTEETTGIDIVTWQLRIADGEALTVTQTPQPLGHSIEFRINAEDPGRGFLPTPGLIRRFRAPEGPGVRLDSGVGAGSTVSALYDSLMAKLVVTGPDRDTTIRRARRALSEFVIEGPATVLPFHRAILQEPDFTAETGFRVHTNWIETEFSGLPPADRVPPADPALIRSFVEIDGRRHSLALPAGLFAQMPGADDTTPPVEAGDDGDILAPMPCLLQKWLVAEGETVAPGQAVAVIEAMKAETPITAGRAGQLHRIAPSGETLAAGARLGLIRPAPA